MDPQNSANLRPSDFMWLQTPEPVSAVCSPSSPQISEDGDPTLVHMGKDSAHSSNHWYDFPTSRESLQVNSTATNTGAIPHRTQDNSESLRDTGTVFDLQRQPHPPRERKSYICGFMGRDCPFMKNKEGGVFRNMAGLREDFLRHLNAFQCTRCGLRFGRRSGLKRHVEERKIPCKAIDTNHLREGCNWVTKELGLAVENVRRAKLYDELKAAMEKCKGLCDLTGQTERKRKKQAQRKSARQIRSGQISTQSDGTLTPTESESDNTANARADAANSPAETISGLGNLGLEEFQQMLGVSGILPVGSQALTSNDADVPIVGMNHDLGSHSGNNTIDPTLIQYPHMNTTVQTPAKEWNTHPAQEIGAASTHPTNSIGSFFDPNIMGDTMWPQNERMDGTRNPTFESQPVSIMGNGGYSSHHFPSNVADLDQYRDFNPSSKPYSAMPASPYAPAATSQSYDAWVFLQTANLLEPGSYNYQQMLAAPDLHQKQDMPEAGPNTSDEQANQINLATGDFDYQVEVEEYFSG